jgi:hypothetical protein
MKKSIIILGIAMAVFTSTKAASTFKSDNRMTATTTVIENEQGDMFAGEGTVSEKRAQAPIADQAIVNPEIIMGANQKTMEEVIAENNKITESTIVNDGSLIYIEKSIEDIIVDDNKIIESANTTELRPLYLDTTIEDKIAEDNAIIGNDAANEVQPLDFEKINKSQAAPKQTNIKMLVGMN